MEYEGNLLRFQVFLFSHAFVGGSCMCFKRSTLALVALMSAGLRNLVFRNVHDVAILMKLSARVL